MARQTTNPRRLLNANLILGLITALYTVSPIDLIPDVIPLLGWADDGAGWLGTFAFTLYTAYRIHRAGGLKALRAEGGPAPVAAQPKAKPAPSKPKSAIDAYEPMSYDEIRAL